jgi:hypothetical protein
MFTLVASLLIGCGASTNDMAVAPNSPKGEAMDSVTSNGSFDGNYVNTNPESSIEKDTDEPHSDTDLYLDSQKLIYSCDIEMETLTFADTVAEIKTMIKSFDGFVESDSMSDNSWNWYYENYKKNGGTLSERIVVRIPTEHYNDFIHSLDGSGKIMSKSERVTNITKSYNDTATTIEMLEKEEDMLLEMMDQCSTIDEMLSVESRLSTVQQRLAIYRSDLGDMDMDIAFSTITIQIREVMEYTKVVAEELKFVERFVDAVKDSCEEFVNVLEDIVIFIVYAAPYIGIGVVIFIIIRFNIKKKKSKRSAQIVKCDSIQNTTVSDDIDDNNENNIK